jgi:hypothetical protein
LSWLESLDLDRLKATGLTLGWPKRRKWDSIWKKTTKTNNNKGEKFIQWRKVGETIEAVVSHRRRIFSVALENVARKFVSDKSAVDQPNLLNLRMGFY